MIHYTIYIMYKLLYTQFTNSCTPSWVVNLMIVIGRGIVSGQEKLILCTKEFTIILCHHLCCCILVWFTISGTYHDVISDDRFQLDPCTSLECVSRYSLCTDGLYKKACAGQYFSRFWNSMGSMGSTQTFYTIHITQIYIFQRFIWTRWSSWFTASIFNFESIQYTL